MKKIKTNTALTGQYPYAFQRILEIENSSSGVRVESPGHSRFKFDLRLGCVDEFCSIATMIVDKVSVLKSNRDVSDFDLKLFPLPPLGKEKMAVLSMTVHGQRYTSESCSPRWDNAFLNATDMLYDQMKPVAH